MRAFPHVLASLAGPAFLLSALAADAAPVAATNDASGKASVLKPLSLLKQSDLDFGELVASGAGTAVIDPVSGSMSTTGAVTQVGVTAHAATFTATGSKNSVVIIRLPTSPATLTLVGGGATLTVANWTLDGNTTRKVPASSAFNFSVGGTLNVAAGQADGTYTGTFNITVQYP
jgi:hypothetical protein